MSKFARPIEQAAKICHRRRRNLTSGLMISMYAFVNLAMSSGQLRLTSADPNAKPHLDSRFFEDEFDRLRMREAILTCGGLGEHEAYAHIIEERLHPTNDELVSDDALDAFMCRTVVSSQHITGTCKMGSDSAPTAVVNQYGRVHSLEGLWVAGASVMPDNVRANTNVTTMMIGERIADFIRQGS